MDYEHHKLMNYRFRQITLPIILCFSCPFFVATFILYEADLMCLLCTAVLSLSAVIYDAVTGGKNVYIMSPFIPTV